jgi:excisionase family DNA binding protein
MAEMARRGRTRIGVAEEIASVLREDLAPDLIAGLRDDVLALLAATSEDRWMDTEAAAVYTGCKQRRLQDLAAKGGIPHGHLGRKLAFKRSELDAYLRRSNAA